MSPLSLGGLVFRIRKGRPTALRTHSLFRLRAALRRLDATGVDLLAGDEWLAPDPEDLSRATLLGVPVIEDARVPPGVVVVMLRPDPPRRKLREGETALPVPKPEPIATAALTERDVTAARKFADRMGVLFK